MNASTARGPALATFSAPRADDALALVGLTVSYRVRGRERDVLTDVSLRIKRGEAYGLVGESGCGKSTVALAVLRYLAHNGRVKSGRIAIGGEDVLKLDREGLRLLRAHKVSMVYQDPASALNPTLTIARQLGEAFEAAGASAADALAQAHAMLARVRIADPARVMASWPHQLSGGMQQRVVIAMALASNPTLLILDEPTTGLDATVEAEVLALVAQLREELGMAVLLISHDLGVIARMCERVGVLYAGRLVEEGATQDVFARARHPYTVGLLRCLPAPGRTKAHGTLDTIAGELPAPGTLTHGCVYAPRCRMADARCHEHAPPPHRMEAPHGEQMARCHYHERAIDLPAADAANASDIDEFDVSASAQTATPPIEEAIQQTIEQTDKTPLTSEDRTAPIVLRAAHLSLTFGHGAQAQRVLNDVSLELRAGETLGLVGESGSGKTTLAKLLLGVHSADAGGTIELDGQPLAARLAQRNARALRALRIVFQHPDASLNRALPVNRLVGRALVRAEGAGTGAGGSANMGANTDNTSRIASLLDAVRVPIRYLNARARQLSGGLKQRVAIAQAFAGEPRVVICDEPTSALDVSVQAAILNLLARLQRERDVSYLFISHDLEVVRYLADRVMVLYAGHVVESGPANAVLGGPCHPYTETLLNAGQAVRTGNPAPTEGINTVSTSAQQGTGCIFSSRCPRRLGAICDESAPPFDADADADAVGHRIRCHIPAAELRELQRAATVAHGNS